MTTIHGGQRIAAANPAAMAAGVMPGQSLADARALYPTLTVRSSDPAADLRALDSLSRAAERYTPWVAFDPFGGTFTGNGLDGGAGLWLDISGCAHLFGGEDVLLDDLLARCRRAGYQAKAGLAATPGAAWTLARFGALSEPETTRPAILPAGDSLRDRLAPLPMAGLRLDGDTVEGLERMGLRRIGDLYNIPRAPLANRFGGMVLRRLDQALGHLDDPLSPRRPVPAYAVRRAFAEPIGRAEDIEAALTHLLDALCLELELAGQGARQLAFILHRVDNSVAHISVGTSRPSREPRHLARLFREKLDKIDPGFGIEVVVLAAMDTNALVAKQTDMAGGTIDTKPVSRLVDILSGRLGPGNVNRLAPVASHLPERTCREVPAVTQSEQKNDWQKPPHQPSRPLQLLVQPTPIDVMAPVPDGPPVMFRWRRQQHKIAKAEGPERIAPEWWHTADRPLHNQPLTRETRDYYRLEDADGSRFWVFREGLYRPDRPTNWYLHGFFG